MHPEVLGGSRIGTEEWKTQSPYGKEEFCERSGISLGGNVGFSLRHKRHSHSSLRNSHGLQGFDCKQRVVDGPQAISRGYNHPAIQGSDQIGNGEIFSRRNHQTTRAFNHQSLAFLGDFLDALDRVAKTDLPPVFGSDIRRQRLRVIKRIHLRIGQFAALQRLQPPDVRVAAGTKRLHGERVNSLLPQVKKQQRRQQCFADASVRAGDEDDFFQSQLKVRIWMSRGLFRRTSA